MLCLAYCGRRDRVASGFDDYCDDYSAESWTHQSIREYAGFILKNFIMICLYWFLSVCYV